MLSILKQRLYDTYINYKYNKIIRETDNYKKNNPLKKNEYSEMLFKYGYVVIEDFIQFENDKEKLTNLKFINKSVKKIQNKIIEENSIAYKIISNPVINDLISSYVGSDAALDYVEHQRTELNAQNISISEKWHYDNVGKRIKIFYFYNDCREIFTDYLSGTNLIYHKKYSTNSSRINKKLLNKFISKNKTIFPKKNRLFIFDTNGYHRGVYRNNNTLNSQAYRDMILLEFSSSKKSDMLNSDILGPRRTFFSKKIDINNTLINNNYLIEFNDFYYYDKNYVKSF